MNVQSALRRKISGVSVLLRRLVLRIDPDQLWYEKFFIKNPYWSTKEPNPDELVRWRHIEKLLALTGRHRFGTIIDFGCGRGWLTSLLTSYGDTLGIEPVRAVVKHGKRLYPHLRLEHGSLSKMRELNADLIVCSEVIEHIPDSEKPSYLRQFYTTLNPGGFLVLTTPRAEALKEWSLYSDASQPVEAWIDESTLIGLCVDAGFSAVSCLRYSETPLGGPPIEDYQLHLLQKQ